MSKQQTLPQSLAVADLVMAKGIAAVRSRLRAARKVDSVTGARIGRKLGLVPLMAILVCAFMSGNAWVRHLINANTEEMRGTYEAARGDALDLRAAITAIDEVAVAYDSTGKGEVPRVEFTTAADGTLNSVFLWSGGRRVRLPERTEVTSMKPDAAVVTMKISGQSCSHILTRDFGSAINHRVRLISDDPAAQPASLPLSPSRAEEKCWSPTGRDSSDAGTGAAAVTVNFLVTR